MDIDSPPTTADDHGHTHLELPEFSLSFPLPFRVLFLVGLAILLWAINLHVLHLLGLDTSWILDFRDPDLPTPTTSDGPEAYELEGGGNQDVSDKVERPPSGKLYGPVYRLFALYCAWVGGGWVLFTWLSGGVEQGMEEKRGLVGIVMVGVLLGGLIPWRGVGERERRGLRKCLRRILFPSMSSPIFFADVILADILTSFAKVLGDLFVSASQIWYGGITHGRVRQYGWTNWLTLSMVCLPYALRLRQCLLESHQARYTSIRPLMNAFKYFSAFPVIILSAMQKTLLDEIAQDPNNLKEHKGTRWHGEYQLFRIWLLAVVVNSMFSFYWDVQMDWGLRLCEVDTWFPARRSEPGLASPPSRGRRGPGLLNRIKSIWSRDPSASNGNQSLHHRSPHPTPQISHTRPNTEPSHLPLPSLSLSPILAPITTFGLRQTLTFDPLVYHLFTLIDLVLRFTWSLKLSSHLHTISEIESGVFLMESLELFRRWMWVFVRVEWEAVKMEDARQARGGPGRDTLGMGLGPVNRSRNQSEVVWDEKERR